LILHDIQHIVLQLPDVSPWGWQDDQPFTDSRVKLREKSWPGDGWTGWADADPKLRPGHMVRDPELREIGSCERMLEEEDSNLS